MLWSEEVKTTVMQCSPVSSSSEVQPFNPIDRSVVGILARWWRLGILALARLALEGQHTKTVSLFCGGG
jgi:hypothetical protein